jgi:branched-chain amino acid transport system substrate-binding protein
MKRRARLNVAVVFAATGLAAAACGSSSGSSSSTPASSSSGTSTAASSSAGGVIKVGVVLPLSGVQAAIAKLENEGYQTAVKQINASGGVDGKQLQIVEEDDALDTTKAATLMRDLNSKGVKLALGGQTSTLCQAEAQAAARFDILYIGAHCTSKTLIDPAPVSANYWMTGQLDTDLTRANGEALASLFPNVTSWDVFGYDQDVTRGFWTQTEAQIAKVTGKPVTANTQVYVAATATDFKTQLSSLVSNLKGSKGTRGLFLAVYGAGTTSFIQQARPLGLLDDYGVIAQTGVYWETAEALNGTAPPIYDVHEYFDSCQSNPENTAFVNDFKALAGELPDTGAYQGYVATEMLAAAIKKAGAADSASVGKAFPGVTYQTPTGLTMTMGANHHADGPITTALLGGDKSAPETISVTDCKSVLSSQLK